MSINLQLFSVPGDRDIRHIVDACRPYLEDDDSATIAYLPQAWLNVRYWLEYTTKAFKNLAQIALIDTEHMTLPEMEAVIRKAQAVYISGGNTFLLNHRLHTSGLLPYLRKKVQAGLPVVGFSAGTVLCGPNVLTSNDLNAVGTPHFAGLNITPFNFYVHYHEDSAQDDWLSDYHTFNDNPVVLMADNAYIKVDGRKTTLVRGDAWILRRDAEKEKLSVGEAIVP